MSTLKVNAIQNASGVEVYTAKAWVNFNGTGTVAIRASGNVSSITDNGTGDYTVNFTNALPDADFAVHFTGGSTTTNPGDVVGSGVPVTSSSARVRTYNTSGTGLDIANQSCTIFR